MSILDKVKLLVVAHRKIEIYIESVKNITIIDIDDLQDDVKKSFSIIEDLSKNIDYTSPDNIPKNIFHIWHLSEYIIQLMKKIESYISDHLSDTDVVKSENITHKLQKLVINIQLTWDILNKKNKLANVEICENIRKYIIWDNNVLDSVATYTSYVKEYPFSILLYCVIIQSSLKYCVKHEKLTCTKIFNMVEGVKNFIMLSDTNRKLGKKILYANNPRLKTFGLTPRGPSSSLQKIFKYIYEETSIKKLTDLKKLTSQKNICVIIFNSVIKNPMEFELWKIIDWGYAKNLIQPDNAGINSQTIERFTTFKFLDPANKYHKWNFKTQHYGDIESELFIILEYLGLDMYRQLSVYNYETSNFSHKFKKGGKSLRRIIQRSRIEHVIEYVKNKGVLFDNTRISEYHRIQENIITKNMFLPIKFDLSAIKENSQELDTAYLRHNMSSRLTKICMSIVKTQYKNGKTIKNMIDIGKIIHSDKLSNMVVTIFIEQYKIYVKNKIIDNNFPQSELLHTLLNQLKLVGREFIRYIHTGFIETNIDAEIFNMTSQKKNTQLKEIFLGIITPVVDKLISNENNVYQALIYKNVILNLSIV